MSRTLHFTSKLLFQLLFILALLFAAKHAISADAPDAKSGKTVYTDPKKAINVKDSQPEFTIEVKSNPTTGYSWFVENYDSQFIRPVKHEYVAPDSKAVGAGGHELWTFRVNPPAFVAPHVLAVWITYMRPWEGMKAKQDSSSSKVFTITTMRTDRQKQILSAVEEKKAVPLANADGS